MHPHSFFNQSAPPPIILSRILIESVTTSNIDTDGTGSIFRVLTEYQKKEYCIYPNEYYPGFAKSMQMMMMMMQMMMLMVAMRISPPETRLEQTKGEGSLKFRPSEGNQSISKLLRSPLPLCRSALYIHCTSAIFAAASSPDICAIVCVYKVKRQKFLSVLGTFLVY